MKLYPVEIGTTIVVAAESAAEAERIALHYAEKNTTGREWMATADHPCDAESLPAGWSERDRVVGPHAMTVGEVLAEAA